MTSQPSPVDLVVSSLASAPSRAELVTDALRRAILGGQLQPGQALVEQELASLLGVSKTPVREALKSLASSGLVVMNAYRGALVRKVDKDLVRSVYELREVLEPHAMKRALTAGAIPLDLAREALVAARQAMKAENYAELGPVNRRFHRTLFSGCDNVLMVSVLDDVHDLTALISVTGWRMRATWRREHEEHEEILAAIEVRDLTLAATKLRQHIRGFANSTVEALDHSLRATEGTRQ